MKIGNEDTLRKPLVQCIKCLKCGSIYAACTIPECYQSDEWLEEIKEASINGDEICYLEAKSFEYRMCKCGIL